MPATDSYVFTVTIAGADAIRQAREIRRTIEQEFKAATLIDVAGVPEAIKGLEDLRKVATGVGKALTGGFRAETRKLLTDIENLQQQVNAVVRAGAGPVEAAFEGLGVMGLDALEIVDAGSTQATQKMARLTTEIRGAQTQIEELQQRMAELGAQPMIPAGSLTGEVRTLSELFHELTGSRQRQVRRMFRDMQADLGPIADELERQTKAARAEAAPAYERMRGEAEELSAALRSLLDQQAELRRGTQAWSDLENEIRLYQAAILETDQEMASLRSAMIGVQATDLGAQLASEQQRYVEQLAASSIWWKELTRGAGEHADIIQFVSQRNQQAGKDLAEMLAIWERIRKLQTSVSRGIGTMQRMGDKIELPPGTEGNLATLVLAEKALGQSTDLATQFVTAQGKALRKLTRELQQAAEAAMGMDRAQREAIRRVQMTAEREMRAATKTSLGLTTEEAGVAIGPILATMNAQVEAIKRSTIQTIEELEEEGQKRKPFHWLVGAAQAVRRMLVGESIIPEMVVAINEWLTRIGIEDPFTDLAMDAQRAAEIIQTGLQTRLKQLNTDQAQQELKELQEEIRETARQIESQLVVTSQASKEYKMAWAAYADEVRRVRGDDPAAMALISQGKALKGTGVRGEFKTLEIIDEGYQAIQTEMQERQRLSEEENAKLLELEQKYTAMRQIALALERELTERKVASLEKNMASALDEEGDVDRFEILNQEYIAAQDKLGEISEEIAFEREMITSKAIAAAEEELQRAKAQARKTLPTALGTQVAGETILPTITKTQTRNVQEYTAAIEELSKSLRQMPTGDLQAQFTALQKTMQDMTQMLPALSEEEQRRMVSVARATAAAAENEKRRTMQYEATVQQETSILQSHLHTREVAVEKSADVVVEQSRRKTALLTEQERQTTVRVKAEAEARAAAEKQEARAASTALIEEERRLTAKLKEEERRRTLDHQDEMRKRAQADREMRRAQMVPTPAEIERYGGGRVGVMSWAVQESQMRQMGLRMLAYDVQYMTRSMMMASAALTGPPILAMRRFAEYTRATDRSARAMELTADVSDELRHALIEQSVALGLASPEDLAEGLYMWTTGVGATAKTYEDLQKVITDTIPIQQLAYMQQLNLGTATENTAGILAEYRMEVSETGRVVEVLNATADRTFATVEDLGEAFKFVGPIAYDLGITMEETAAALGILSDANIKGSMAGRAMRQLFAQLVKTTEEEDEALNNVLRRNTELGESWRDLAFPEGQFIGLGKWIDLLAAATENMTEEQRGNLLATIATANELPSLTAMVTRQIEARQHGINIIRAEEKILTGAVDAEVQAYAELERQLTGNLMSLESAHDSFERKVRETTESEAYQLDKLQREWDAAMLALGEHTMKIALPALKELTEVVGDIAEFIADNPWIAEAMLVAGGVIGAVAIMGTTAASLLRIITMIRTVTTVLEGLKAARAMETAAAATQAAAAGTQVAAAGTQEVAAGSQVAAAELQQTAAATQNTANVGLLGGLGKFLLGLTAVLGGVQVGALVAGEVRGEPVGFMDALEEIWKYMRESGALIAGIGGAAAAAILGEDPMQGYIEATYEVGKLFGLLEDQVQPAVEETGEELRDWNVELERARRGTQALENDLMQLPPAIEEGLAAFSEAELEAIDALEDYLRRRDDLVKEHNQELIDLEADFLAEQAEQYQDYTDERQDLLDELAQVTDDPLWLATEEVQESLEREQEALEEYTESVEDILADHQKKLRDLREDHDDKMQDLEAARDAKGILDERTRYAREVRDANEQAEELLETEEERLDEALEEEREQMATLREERQADIEEQLKQLDEQYEEEDRKRQEAYAKELDDLKKQQANELSELEKAHATQLASIMGWEEQIRQALRDSYAGREEDLRQHLFRMEQLYNQEMGQEPIEWTTLPFTGLPIPTTFLGLQAGGYAPSGLYRLGEAGSEFVLSASTTRAMERAMGGRLTQSNVMNMSGGHYRLDIRVTADDHFSPAFAKQTEALVRAEIVNLANQVTQGSNPGAYRPH